MATTGRNVLLAVDESVRAEYRRGLAADGHEVLVARAGRELLALLGHAAVQVAVIDPDVVGLPGADLLDLVREHDALVQIVLVTERVGGPLPRLALPRPDVHGYHDRGDGVARLRLQVSAALATYDRLADLSVAVRLKTELIASVSHELRTPLSVIIGYVELLCDGTFGACPPEVLRVLDKVMGNATNVLQLIEEFLDLTRIETRSTRLRHEVVELTPFLRDLAESFTLLVRTKPLRFVAEVPDGLPAVVVDPAKLRVIVQNLLSNAAKFTRQGHIRLLAGGLDAGLVAIRVSDSGPGIPAEQQEAIFDVFHQLEGSDADAKGIGLGLALARRFARLLGGEITVESQVGQGATFTVVLPVAAIESEVRAVQSSGERLGV